MTWSVEVSYAHCRTVARRAATNFYLSFFTLPKAKRQAMYALYAFLRMTDDLGDNQEPVETRRAALIRWRTSLERSLAGEFDSPLFPALADTVARFDIPPEYLFAAIDGVATLATHRAPRDPEKVSVSARRRAAAAPSAGTAGTAFAPG